MQYTFGLSTKAGTGIKLYIRKEITNEQNGQGRKTWKKLPLQRTSMNKPERDRQLCPGRDIANGGERAFSELAVRKSFQRKNAKNETETCDT